MALTRDLVLVEQGEPVVVPDGDWADATAGEPLRRLATAGVIGARRSNGFVILEPRQYVGHLRFPGRSITIVPKSTGMAALMRGLATNIPDKIASGEQRLSDRGASQVVDPGALFVETFDGAVWAGLPFDYRTRDIVTSRPRGKLLFGDTLRHLASHGIRHAVWASLPERVVDPELGDLVTTTASILLSESGLSGEDASRLNRLAPLVDSIGSVVTTDEGLQLAAGAVTRHEGRPEIGRLLAACEAVLRRETGVWDVQFAVPGGECRFSDMNRLWEVAVLVAHRRAAAAGLRIELHPLRRAGISVTDGDGPEVDPDILVYAGDAICAVVDAKYVEARAPVADDVYQVMSYARRLESPVAILVYVSPGPTWSRDLGRGDGVHVLGVGLTSTETESGVIAGIASTLTRAGIPVSTGALVAG